MSIYNVHAGHNNICPGAARYLNEVAEDRKVKNRLIQLLQYGGHTVYDCTDDVGRTSGANLANICAKCNSHNVNLDISIHLNAGGGTGVEVWYYTGSSAGANMASKVSASISSALGIRNRGAKASSGLYVLRNTKATAILIECCFVDNMTDKNAWNANKCADAIYKAVVGGSVPNVPVSSGGGSNSSSSFTVNNCLGAGDSGSAVRELQNMLIACGYSCGSCGADGIFGSGTKSAVRAFQRAYGLSVDGLAGVNTMAKLRSVYSGRGGHWVSRLQAECNAQGFSNQAVDGIPGANTLAGCPQLGRKSQGGITRLVQEKLISLGYSCGSCGADGINGAGTQAAIKAFQRAKGLAVDGIVGTNTWRKLLGL